jgi:hypothetical protein
MPSSFGVLKERLSTFQIVHRIVIVPFNVVYDHRSGHAVETGDEIGCLVDGAILQITDSLGGIFLHGYVVYKKVVIFCLHITAVEFYGRQ